MTTRHRLGIGLLAGVLLGAASWAWAHGGGLDQNGGHFDRKTGLYHFHRGPSAAPKPAAQALVAEPARDRRPLDAEALGALLVRKGLVTQAELDAARR